MRLRVLVPVLLALALAAGLVAGARLPGDQSPAAAQDPSGPATPGGSPSPSTSSSDGSSTPATDVDPDPFKVTKLKPGEKPPQFVVISFDGAANHELLQSYMTLAREHDAHYSFNLSGVYILPEEKADAYDPPRHNKGTSAIGFADRSLVPDRIRDWTQAYEEGHEIATHYNGHFCGENGVGDWNTADWESEITQFNDFVNNWRTYYGAGSENIPDLPFTTDVIVGGRTPCLEGRREQMYAAFKKFGYRYDASGTGSLEWPSKTDNGLWEFPLQTIKIPGFRPNLSMDYNIMYAQNGGKTTDTAANAKKFEQSTYQAYTDALDAVYDGNRAPLFLGNHLNTWIQGTYTRALQQFITERCDNPDYPDVQCVSNEDLADWLDAQDPKVVKALQAEGTQDY